MKKETVLLSFYDKKKCMDSKIKLYDLVNDTLNKDFEG